jgi:hypothetical protein
LGFSEGDFSGVVEAEGRGAASGIDGVFFTVAGTARKSGGRGASSAAFDFGVVRKSGGRGASSAGLDGLRLRSRGVPDDDAESG